MNAAELSQKPYNQFFSQLGFDDDPFQYTNADEEERLADYFVPPPYFPSVFGDPTHPKSFVVFAPRGGGKSAQRRIIETTCSNQSVLSITYDQFEFPEAKKASDVVLQYHLKNIIRYIIMGLLITIYNNSELKNKLSKNDKELLVRLSIEYLDGISELTLKNAIDSLKGFKDKVKDFWNEWLPAISIGLSTFLKKLIDIDVNTLEKYAGGDADKPQYQKYILQKLPS